MRSLLLTAVAAAVLLGCPTRSAEQGGDGGGAGGSTGGGAGGGSAGAGGGGGGAADANGFAGPYADDDLPLDCSGDAGQCFFVAPNGSDSDPGTEAAPFGTFRPALSQVQPGDTIVVRGGQYGAANMMVTFATTDPQNPAPDGGVCPRGKFEDGQCWWDHRGFLGLTDVSGYGTLEPVRTVNSGTAGKPITVRNYPGELPVLEMSSAAPDQEAIYVLSKSYWIIRGLEISSGGVDIQAKSTGPAAHDLHFIANDIHGKKGYFGNNDGLIFIERADGYGAYNIYVRHNRLHDMFNFDMYGDTENVGAQQFVGAVTTMSCEWYTSNLNCGGTGNVEILGNIIYRIPQVFFFKNPNQGPVLIQDNVVTEAGDLGSLGGSNVTLRNNLLVDVNGFDRGGGGGMPEIAAAEGDNGVFEHNTFVRSTFAVRSTGSRGHQLHQNIYFAPRDRKAGATYDSFAVYMRGDETRALEADDAGQSELSTWSADDNCIVSDLPDFLMLSRFSATQLNFYTLAEVQQTFGFDVSSTLVPTADAGAIFVDPANGDYTVRIDGPCAGKGYLKP